MAKGTTADAANPHHSTTQPLCTKSPSPAAGGPLPISARDGRLTDGTSCHEQDRHAQVYTRRQARATTNIQTDSQTDRQIDRQTDSWPITAQPTHIALVPTGVPTEPASIHVPQDRRRVCSLQCAAAKLATDGQPSSHPASSAADCSPRRRYHAPRCGPLVQPCPPPIPSFLLRQRWVRSQAPGRLGHTPLHDHPPLCLSSLARGWAPKWAAAPHSAVPASSTSQQARQPASQTPLHAPPRSSTLLAAPPGEALLCGLVRSSSSLSGWLAGSWRRADPLPCAGSALKLC